MEPKGQDVDQARSARGRSREPDVGEEMTERHHCPDCARETDFASRYEGNLSTGEEWRITYCLVCRWERERVLVRGKVIHVRADFPPEV